MYRVLYARGSAVVGVARSQQLSFMAAAIAYYAFLSVVPLVIVGLTVASMVAGERVATRVLDTIGQYLTPEAASLVEESIVAAPGRGSVTAIGLVVLLWGALRVFRALGVAFSRIYGSDSVKPLGEQLVDALVVLVAVAAAVASTTAVGVLLPLSALPMASAASVLGLMVLVVVFFPLYYVFPARDMRVREALPGAIFASIGWTALGLVFGIYATTVGGFEVYGLLGGVVLLLVWFYFGGLCLLLGAAINATSPKRSGDRQLQQGGPPGISQRTTMTDADEPTETGSTGGTQHGDERTDGGQPTGDSPAERDSPGAQPADDGPGSREANENLTRDDLEELRAELDRLGAAFEERTVAPDDLEDLEESIDDRTVHREEIEGDLEAYVRRRVRRGHARGWGPYLVLLYGTGMTIGAFYFLGGGWAILAMLVVWLSTLGLYVLMLLVGWTTAAIGLPGRVLDRLRRLR